MTGPQLLEGQMLTEVKRQADFYSELSYDENYPTQETLEEVDWEGSAAYKVKFADADGNETIQYFVPGRFASVTDFGFDVLGALAAAALITWRKKSARSAANRHRYRCRFRC